MMNCCTRIDNEGCSESAFVEKELVKDRKAFENVITCLLIGTSQSGKSTILKQMILLHRNGFSQHEKDQSKAYIIMNIIECFVALHELVQSKNLQYEKEINKEYGKDIVDEYNRSGLSTLSIDLACKLSSVASDRTIKDFLEETSWFKLPCSTKYFVNELPRILRPGWSPSDDDILRCQRLTRTIVEVDFPIPASSIILRMVDVGGQKSERRKWMHLFECVSTVIFCVAISDYDLQLSEDTEKNRMLDSLEVFEAIINSRWFSSTAVGIFFNKNDIFIKKLEKIPLANFFPAYNDILPKNSVTATQFITQMYKQKNRSNNQVYSHLTNATDTKPVCPQASRCIFGGKFHKQTGINSQNFLFIYTSTGKLVSPFKYLYTRLEKKGTTA